MFASRVVQFAVRNPSAIAAAYEWRVDGVAGSAAGAEGAAAPPPFSIEPSEGVLRAGETAVFSARFAPLDAADFESAAALFLSPAGGSAGGGGGGGVAAGASLLASTGSPLRRTTLALSRAGMAGALPSLALALSGRAQRPVLHLDLPASS
jgi:hypothetical protein